MQLPLLHSSLRAQDVPLVLSGAQGTPAVGQYVFSTVQSWSLEQPPRQPGMARSQTKPLQETGEPSPGHRPAALQLMGAWYDSIPLPASLVHSAASQLWPTFRYVQLERLVPLQLPPQKGCEPHALRSPTGGPVTATQLPAPLHCSQVPSQTALQHTPWPSPAAPSLKLQMPVLHWLVAVQAVPPLALGTQEPPLQ